MKVIYPEPCMMYGSFTAYPHPNVHGIVPAPGTIGNFYVPHLPGHQEGGLIYGMPPANGYQHGIISPMLAQRLHHHQITFTLTQLLHLHLQLFQFQ